jgi:hypothetical protein
MAYHPIQPNPNTPSIVVDFIARLVDMQFHDVHCMLRLPIPEHQLDAGCNFAAATYLLALISGLSTVLYRQGGRPGYRFKALMQDFYPWKDEPSGSFPAKAAIPILYELFRTPLTHTLGLNTEASGEGSNTIIRRGRRPKLIAIAKLHLEPDKDHGLPEWKIEELERSVIRPAWLPATLRESQHGKKLVVESLYWGTRCLVTKLTANTEKMTAAEQFLNT